MQDVAAPGVKQQSPDPTPQRQDGPATQPPHCPDHDMALPWASAAADCAQLPTASSHTNSLNLSPHVAHEEPVEQETLAQHCAFSTMSQHPCHVEATAADADAAFGAADQVCQMPCEQSQGISSSPSAPRSDHDVKLPTYQQSLGPTAHPMAGSCDLEANPPVPKVASQAPAVPFSAHSNGQIMSSHLPQLSGQNGLAGLAAEVHRWEQRVLTSPVQQQALKQAEVQQAAAESNDWHEGERHRNDGQQQGDVSNASLVSPHCSGSQELVQSCTAKHNSHELPAYEAQSQNVPVAQDTVEAKALPGPPHSAQPLVVGRKRQMEANDDHIVTKKQCVSLSGFV